MGAIYRFDLKQLKEQYNLENYIETGTGEGVCLKHAMQFDFARYFSCEIFTPIWDKVAAEFSKYKSVYIENNNSAGFILFTLSNSVLDSNANLIFLDAHFPGADFHYKAYDGEKDMNLRLPLKRELEIIEKYRTGKNDVIIIDDLRVYMDGPFHDGNWPLRKQIAGDNNADFIFETLERMGKKVTIDWRDQGYVIAVPK
jgi:hypothetical protein